eukprot:6210187-Pleurochrysis_carterae.AAC.3
MPIQTSPAMHERTYHGPERRLMISMFASTAAPQCYQREKAKLQRNYFTIHELVEDRPVCRGRPRWSLVLGLPWYTSPGRAPSEDQG